MWPMHRLNEYSLVRMLVIMNCFSNILSASVRLCTPGDDKKNACYQMTGKVSFDANDQIHCTPARDRYECLQLLITKFVDVALLDPEDIYIGQKLFDGQLKIIGETRLLSERGEKFRYEAVAVVKKASAKRQLNGLRSCHTGYGRTAGWAIPYSQLIAENFVEQKCELNLTAVENQLATIASLFPSACIPGKWVPDNGTDMKLKAKYSHLCELCDNPMTCSSEDAYAGYTGTLDCLLNNNADIAWTKYSAARSFFQNKNESSNYGLLCPDGTVNDFDRPCPWGSRPWPAWVVSQTTRNLDSIHELITKVFIKGASEGNPVSDWAEVLLEVKKPSVFVPKIQPEDLHNYLSNARYASSIKRMECENKAISLCVNSEAARRKCEAFANVLESRRSLSSLKCIMSSPDSDCMALVYIELAHITTADSSEAYHAHLEFDLTAIAAEQYGIDDASYFSVAVVHKNSGINSFADLKGKKSCHTGMGRTAGWKIPVSSLIAGGYIQEESCDYPSEMANFFTDSCVPGAKSPKYDPYGKNPSSLCNLCIGRDVVSGVQGPAYNFDSDRDSDRCSKDFDLYSGYSGAFRCLVEGGGDVAFVKHTTVLLNTDGKNNDSWARNLISDDFRLLCRFEGTAPVYDYSSCNLARIPAHKVVSNPNLPESVLEDARILLLKASDLFPTGQDVFRLFGEFQGEKDLIFKDSATALVNIPEDQFHASIEDSFYEQMQKIDNCGGTNLPVANGATNVCLERGLIYLFSFITILSKWIN